MERRKKRGEKSFKTWLFLETKKKMSSKSASKKKKKRGAFLWSLSSKRISPIDYSIFSSEFLRLRRRRRELARDRSPEIPSEELLVRMLWQSLIMKEIWLSRDDRSDKLRWWCLMKKQKTNERERGRKDADNNSTIHLLVLFQVSSSSHSLPPSGALHIWDYCFCRRRERERHWKVCLSNEEKERKMDQLELLLRCYLSGNKSTSRNYVCPRLPSFFLPLSAGLSFLLHSLIFRTIVSWTWSAQVHP